MKICFTSNDEIIIIEDTVNLVGTLHQWIVMDTDPVEIGLGVSLFIPGKNANSQVKIFTKAFLEIKEK